MTTYIFSWKMGSEGASQLAEALNIRKIRHENSTFKGNKSKTVINWGASELPPEVMKSTVLNRPEAVKICTNKRSFFEQVSGKNVTIPDWTTSSDVAMRWVAEGFDVCARTVLNGHSGAGLRIMDKNNPNSFVKAPLYTKYVPKEHEYRVHVVRGRVIDIQRKALRDGYLAENPHPNWKVRNLDNGFIYIRNDVNPPASVSEQAIAAINSVGLDFGAVDIIYNNKRKQAYVLEINTAPGLQGTTITNWAEALRNV